MDLNELRYATIALDREMQRTKDSMMRPPMPVPERMKHWHYLELLRRRKPPSIIARRTITADPDEEHLNGLRSTSPETEQRFSPKTQPEVEEITLDESDEEPPMANNTLHMCLYGFPKNRTVCFACGNLLELNKFVALCQSCRFLCHISCIESIPRTCDPDIFIMEPQSVKITTEVMYCLLEIENRCEQTGLQFYDIDVSPSLVKALMEEIDGNIYLQGDLKMVDVNVLCTAVKMFLRDLGNPLIPLSLREQIRMMAPSGLKTSQNVLKALTAQLSKDRLETVAVLMRHFKKLLELPRTWKSKREQENILSALLFGASNHDHSDIETYKNQSAFCTLMSVSEKLWSQILKENPADSCQNVANNNIIAPLDIPDYRQIYIPVMYFVYAMCMVEEQSLGHYLEELTESDYVPYMLTEYINDEETKDVMREYFQPHVIPLDYRRHMLKMQPEFASYFNNLPI